MFYCFVYTLIVFGFYMRGQAQFHPEGVSSEEILRSNARHKLLGSNLLSQVDIRSVSNVEKLEFRTESREWDTRRQEYVLRMSFLGNRVRKLYNDQNHFMMEEVELALAHENNQLIREAYQEICEWKYTAALIPIYEDLRTLLNDEEKVIKAHMQEDDRIDIIKLITIKDEKQNIGRELDKLKRDLAYVRQKLMAPDEMGVLDLQTNDWIQIAQIESIVTGIMTANSEDEVIMPVEYKIQNNKIARDKLDSDIEIAQGRRILDFTQIKYTGRDKVGFGDEWSIGLGLNIPLPSSNMDRINEAKLNLVDEKTKMLLLKSRVERDLQVIYKKLQDKVDQWESMSEYQKEFNLSSIIDSFTISGMDGMQSYISLKKTLHLQRIELLKVEKDIYDLYIQLLGINGNLIAEPLRNYLDIDISIY